MASTNQSPEYQKAEMKFRSAISDEEKLRCLEEMVRLCPKHKSSEKMLANLKTRYVKLKKKIEKETKTKKGGKQGIKKADMQAILIGLTNSGKSSIMKLLTNATPEIAAYQYTTKKSVLGSLIYDGANIQLIDLPAIESEYFDQGLAHTADLLIITIEKIEDLQKILPFLENATNNRLIIFNKTDLLTKNEQRKIQATLKSKKYNFITISAKTKQGLEELKEKIWQSFDKIRVYTKQHGKQADKEPIVLNKEATVKDAAEKILHGMSKQVKSTTLTGPSAKFKNQKVGLEHVLKDRDVIEFKIK